MSIEVNPYTDKWLSFGDLSIEDVVNHPPHYKGDGVECIDAIRSALTEEEFRGYCKGNVIKYTWRERLKGGIQSLHKALWYLKELTKDK